MVKYLIIILLLLVSSAWAGQVTVSSLPVMINEASHSAYYNDSATHTVDTLTIDGVILYSDTSGIKFISTFDWFLQGLGDTVAYCSSVTAWRTRGIELSGACTNIVIDDATVIQYAQHIDTTADWSGTPDTSVTNDTLTGNSVGIFLDGIGAHGNTIQNCYIEVNGYSSQCVWIGGQGQQLFQNSIIRSNSCGYRTRATYDGAAIKASGWYDSVYTDEGYDYHFRIYNVTVERSPHSCIAALSFSNNYWFVGEVEACTLTCDAWNIMYPVYDGSVQHGTASTYGVHFLYGGDNCLIKNNRILSGSAHKGGRGFFLEGWTPSDGNYATVCSNYVDVHEGTDVAFTGVGEAAYWPCGGKIRSRTANTDVYDNIVIYTADGSVPEGTIGQNSNSYSPHGSAMTYQNPQCSPPYNVSIYNNLFRTLDLDSSIGVAGVKFDEAHCWDASWNWSNNRVESPHWGYKMMGFEGASSGNRIISGDTLKIVDTTYNTDETYHWAFLVGEYNGGAAGDADSNFFRDMVYEDADGNAIDYDTNIAFLQTNQIQNMWNEITCSIYVTDSGGTPVENADAWVVNDYGVVVCSAQTNAAGIVSDVITYNFESRTQTDSLLADFRPFILVAMKDGDSTGSSLNLGWDLKKDTLLLGAGAAVSNYTKFQGIKIKGVTIQ